jgi:hypothetical protein
MELMPTRYTGLKYTLAGYEKLKVPLVALRNDTYLSVGVGRNDDIGIYYFIPKISHILDIPIENAFFYFFFT